MFGFESSPPYWSEYIDNPIREGSIYLDIMTSTSVTYFNFRKNKKKKKAPTSKSNRKAIFFKISGPIKLVYFAKWDATSNDKEWCSLSLYHFYWIERRKKKKRFKHIYKQKLITKQNNNNGRLKSYGCFVKRARSE